MGVGYLLWTDGLVVMAGSDIGDWRDSTQSGVMGVDVNGAVVVVGEERQRVTRMAVEWPSGVCGGGD